MTLEARNDIEPALVAAARANDRIPTRAATPEQIDLVCALRTLAAVIPTLLPRVVTGEAGPNEWADLADTLYRAARLCREQVVIDSGD